LYWKILAYLGLMVIIGTLVGEWMLHRIPEQAFRLIFRLVLMAVALRLVVVEVLLVSGLNFLRNTCIRHIGISETGLIPGSDSISRCLDPGA
jgi:hypothetical protein